MGEHTTGPGPHTLFNVEATQSLDNAPVPTRVLMLFLAAVPIFALVAGVGTMLAWMFGGPPPATAAWLWATAAGAAVVAFVLALRVSQEVEMAAVLVGLGLTMAMAILGAT